MKKGYKIKKEEDLLVTKQFINDGSRSIILLW